MRLKRHLPGTQALRPSAGRRATAFTVTELMLAVAIMGVIVFSLYSVFNQTQKALRSTQTQGDVAEKARAIVDLIARELQQAHATFGSIPDRSKPLRNGKLRLLQEDNIVGGFEYLGHAQKSDRGDIQGRTNFLQNIFFYTHHTNAWQGIGYRVVNVTNGVGSLVRYETNYFNGRPPTNNVLPTAFNTEIKTNVSFHHVADGVIHLAFIPYDNRGFRLGFDTTNKQSNFTIYRTDAGGNPVKPGSDINTKDDLDLATVVLMQVDPNPRAETLQYASGFAFKSNALPSYVDLEFAILEPETLSQYYSMLQDKNPNATNFLAKQVTKVHLFRQRIPIRSAAP